MLLRYGIENHLSICDYQEISCAASSLKDEPSYLLQVKTRGTSIKEFVPLVVLYGANAAGKSNMIGGLRFLFSAVTDSYDQWRNRKTLPHMPCGIYSDSEKGPSRYDCDVLIGEVRYHYGFEISKDGIVAEWLNSYPHGLKKVLLKRDFRESQGQTDFFGPSVTKLNPSHHELARDTKSLFLSASGAVTHEIFTPVFNFFKESMVIITPSASRPQQLIAQELSDDDVKKSVEDFLEKADFGIAGLKIVTQKVASKEIELRKKLQVMFSEFVEAEVDMNCEEEEKVINLIHKSENNKTFEVSQTRESTGTKHLLSMIVPILSALKTGKTVVIDEITTTLHTKLSEEIIKLFASPDTNKNNAQFIFSTHDTNLLSSSALRRDEIWFAEKNSQGKTSIYPLSDFQTRKSDNLERGYLQGRFGAIPFFGDFSDISFKN